jgi:hypothetical protein
MPLLDHFRPPLRGRRHWESFLGCWANEMAGALNLHLLPEDYVAETNIHVGGAFAIDVATLEEEREARNGGGATVKTWAPPAAALVMPATYPDEFEVQVFDMSAGPTLVAAIELVSPGNKDREETRFAFVAKCAALLQAGIGLVVIDIVTERRANLHNELVRALRQEAAVVTADPALYAMAYRPRKREDKDEIEMWPFALTVGQALPTEVPLALRGGPIVPLDLEATYTAARTASRL